MSPRCLVLCSCLLLLGCKEGSDDTGPVTQAPPPGSTHLGLAGGGGTVTGDQFTLDVSVGDPVTMHRVVGTNYTLAVGIGTAKPARR